MSNGRPTLKVRTTRRGTNPPVPDGEGRRDVVSGICHGCSRRTYLWLPGRICTKCLNKVQAQMLAALEEMGDD